MKKTSVVKSFFALLTLTAALTSCEQCRNVTISEPTPEDSQWLVYKPNDTTSFRTETSDTIRYIRTGIYAENVPGEGFTMEDECIEKINIQVRTLIEDLEENHPYMGTRILSTPEDLAVELFVGEKVNDKSVETGAWEIDEHNAQHDSLEVNSQMYYNVFEVNPASTSNANSVEEILFNKQFGFLRVSFYNGKVLERIP